MYFQLEGLVRHDNRDTDAIVTHSTAWYDIRLSSTGGNVTWRGTREVYMRKISEAQTVSCATEARLLGGEEKGK